MAYGITNKANFRDDNGIYYGLHILKDGYVGASSDFNVGGDGFKLSYSGRGEKADTPIHSSEVTFEFILRDNDDRNRILDIMSQQEGKYIARIYMNNSGTEVDFAALSPVFRFWTGVIVMNESIMEDIDYPQIIQLRAIDGLELLKSKDFNTITNIYNERSGDTDATIKTADSNGDFEGGYYTLQSLILGILNQNPISEVFLDNPTADSLYGFWGGWWSSLTNISQADGYYDCSRLIIVKSSAFYQKPSVAGGTIKYMSCYEALEKILFYLNAKIHQGSGLFHIVQLSVYAQWQDDNNANYVLYSKGGTELVASNNFQKELATENNKRSLTKYNFSRIIKRLIYNIAGITEANPLNFDLLSGGQQIMNQINFPGNQLQSAWHTFNEYTLTTDSTPSAADYKSTFLYVESGQDMTFVFNNSTKYVINSQTNSAWNDQYFTAFITKNIIRIKNDTQDYYLKFDATEDKYVWSTVEGPVLPLVAGQGYVSLAMNEYALTWETDVNYYTTNTFGAVSLDNMEACPVSGLIEYYSFTQYYGAAALDYDADGNVIANSFVDLTSAIGGEITATASPNYNNYGPAFDLPVTSCQVYVNGEAPSFVAYEYINENSGVIVDNGEEIVDTLNFVEQFYTQGETSQNVIYIKDSNTYQENNFILPLSPSWSYLYDTSGMSDVHLPSLKAMTLIGMQKNYKMKMDTRIVRDTDTLNKDPFEYVYLLKDNIEGADRYFICLGGEYIATPAYFTAEWQEVNFNEVQKGNTGFVGNFLNHHNGAVISFVNESLPNNKPPKIK